MANLKDLGHHIFGRSLFKDPQFLHHNCTSHTGGMAFATQMGGGGNVGGTNYGVWSLSQCVIHVTVIDCPTDHLPCSTGRL